MAVLTRLVLVAVLVTSGSVERLRMSMTPNPIIHGKTSTLTIRCDPDASSEDVIFVIILLKSPSTKNLALVDANGPRVDPSIQQRTTVTGSLSPTAESHLVLTFNDAITCNDQGEYSCGYTSNKIAPFLKTQTLQSISDPSNIEMMARPDKFFYNVDDTVELVCSGNVGKPANGTWTWETKHVSLETTWTPLRPGLTPEHETPHASGLCQMTGRSTLTFQVQMEDDNRMYTCYYGKTEYSASFTIRFNANGAGCPRSEVKGKAVGAGLAVWALLTDLLILGGEGHVQRFFT